MEFNELVKNHKSVAILVAAIVLLILFLYFTKTTLNVGGKGISVTTNNSSTSNAINIDDPDDILDWEKRKYVVELNKEFSGKTKIYTEEIYKCFPSFENNSLPSVENVISKEEAVKIITRKKHRKLFEALKGISNYIEGLSNSYLYGVAHRAMFEISFKNLIGKWYGHLQAFVKEAETHCDCVWPPFDKLGERWVPEAMKNMKESGSAGKCFESPA